MNRRAFSYRVTGVVSLGSLAGCLGSKSGSNGFTVRAQQLSNESAPDAFAIQSTDFSEAQSAAVEEMFSYGVAVRVGDDQAELFEDGAYIATNDTYYRIDRSDTSSEPVERRYGNQYEFSVTEVATDDDEFRAVVENERDIVRLSSSDLTEETGAIFDDITERGEYDATTPYSEAQQDVIDALDLSSKETGSDERVIRYDRSYYEITVRWSHGD